MRSASPKYIPREWMLIEAYERAELFDFTVTRELLLLFASPYDEHSKDVEMKYFRKTPEKWRNRARAAFMT